MLKIRRFLKKGELLLISGPRMLINKNLVLGKKFSIVLSRKFLVRFSVRLLSKKFSQLDFLERLFWQAIPIWNGGYPSVTLAFEWSF